MEATGRNKIDGKLSTVKTEPTQRPEMFETKKATSLDVLVEALRSYFHVVWKTFAENPTKSSLKMKLICFPEGPEKTGLFGHSKNEMKGAKQIRRRDCESMPYKTQQLGTSLLNLNADVAEPNT